MSGAYVVQTQDLTKKYGEFTALDGLTIQLEKGKILGFIGPNGAGKTTTIKILVGMALPTRGWAKIAGIDCSTRSREIKRLVGFMPDTFGGYDNMRVHEYLDFFGAAFAIPRSRRQKRVDEALETTGATSMRDLFVESLSHGMKQRVAIARTLLHEPPVLILDEPANGLDPTARVEMRHILLNLADMGKTLIVTSHILPELARICNMVAIITGGKLRAFGTLEQIMHEVREKRMIEVQLAAREDVEKAAVVLTAVLGPKVVVQQSATEGMVRFTTTQNDVALARVLAALVEAKIAVAQFRDVPQDLEDAFLSVTQRENTPAGAATGKTAPSGGHA